MSYARHAPSRPPGGLLRSGGPPHHDLLRSMVSGLRLRRDAMRRHGDRGSVPTSPPPPAGTRAQFGLIAVSLGHYETLMSCSRAAPATRYGETSNRRGSRRGWCACRWDTMGHWSSVGRTREGDSPRSGGKRPVPACRRLHVLPNDTSIMMGFHGRWAGL
ncbi:hypothetical protein HPP92_014508 [Vanilla planifolia]|uniref:Uncharacterized protein n=1 Tax=Vanilla planifolia TaxID=51239 RepID=A0A835QVZ1_VANPL|nr:hypothetical protein HPP92_014508 [Vanilla planifolia]